MWKVGVLKKQIPEKSEGKKKKENLFELSF